MEFAKATNILQFMKDEGLIVFTNLKQNWDGIQGVTVLTSSTLNSPSNCLPVSSLQQEKFYLQSSKSLRKNSTAFVPTS
jgi:hypothetical protein